MQVIHTTRKGKLILLFFPLILNYSVRSLYSIQTLVITLLRSVVLTVPGELGLPVFLYQNGNVSEVGLVCLTSDLFWVLILQLTICFWLSVAVGGICRHLFFQTWYVIVIYNFVIKVCCCNHNLLVFLSIKRHFISWPFKSSTISVSTDSKGRPSHAQIIAKMYYWPVERASQCIWEM